MEKMFRGVEQTFKKQRILKPLHEFLEDLEEQQEPYLLDDYLLDRQYSSKRVYSCSNDDLTKECCKGLPKLVVQSKKPHLRNLTCLQNNDAEHSPRAWSSARCLLEMNNSQKKKRRRALAGKNRTNNLYTMGYSEEYPMEELNISVNRLKFTLLEGSANEMMKRESTAGLIMENVGTSISESEGRLIQFQLQKRKEDRKGQEKQGNLKQIRLSSALY